MMFNVIYSKWGPIDCILLWLLSLQPDVNCSLCTNRSFRILFCLALNLWVKNWPLFSIFGCTALLTADCFTTKLSATASMTLKKYCKTESEIFQKRTENSCGPRAIVTNICWPVSSSDSRDVCKQAGIVRGHDKWISVCAQGTVKCVFVLYEINCMFERLVLLTVIMLKWH